ncbi:MAG: PIG-L family deacetylase [Candidatus Gracilibacteria bacterium]|nr:PIG-L family deacetylase [Candidatus Gracilibacteria bacterium]
MNKKILIITAHPDDEVLGMGGTIQKYILDGFIVDIFLLSKPINARQNEEEGEIRLKNFKEVCLKLGINEIFYSDFPDTSFDSVRLLDLIKKIEEVLDISKPKTVYTHFYNDLNIDHGIVSKATLTALRPFGKYSFVKTIFMFEVLSTTELAIGKDTFIPNYYENIENFIENKKKIFSIYETEIREFPHPRSFEGIEVLAKYRGMESGLKYAEAFILYRNIN